MLAVGLTVAALVYVVFAAIAGAWGWLAVELGGVLLYGAFAWLGAYRATLWLAAGWALHVAWDAGLHLAGPGAAIAPSAYPLLCIAFDALVAVAIALGLHRRAAGGREPKAQTQARPEAEASGRAGRRRRWR